jgi:hypothetical protein
LKPVTSSTIASPGNTARPPAAEDHLVAALVDHRAPLGRRRLRPEADEAEAGGEQDGEAHAQRAADDDRRQDRRQDGAQEQPVVGRAERAGGLDVDLGGGRQRRAVGDAGVAGDADDRHRQDGVVQAGAEHRRQRHRQQDVREGQQQVHDRMITVSVQPRK